MYEGKIKVLHSFCFKIAKSTKWTGAMHPTDKNIIVTIINKWSEVYEVEKTTHSGAEYSGEVDRPQMRKLWDDGKIKIIK